MTKRSGFLAATGAALLLSLSSFSADAVTVAETPSPSQAHADASVGKVSLSVEEEEDGLACTKSRKRMFVDGEGWIVRRVTTCR